MIKLKNKILGNRSAPLPPQPTLARDESIKKKDEEEEEEEETSSSSEETESETDDSEPETRPANSTSSNQTPKSESTMARTDIGPLLARSAEARRGSKEDSPTTRQAYLHFFNHHAILNNYYYKQILIHCLTRYYDKYV